MKIKVTDEYGKEEYIHPESISCKITSNLATEVILSWPNKSGMNTNKLKSEDIITIEEDQ